MTLVRCPTHGIPFNDQNPRGCPACAQERQGRKSQVAMMKELAEASQPIDEKALAAALEGPGVLERISEWMGGLRGSTKSIARFGPVIIVILLVALFLASRPTFVDQPDPPLYTGTTQPLPIMPGQPTSFVHAVLGVQQPSTHPQSAQAIRYSYGTDLIVDEINGLVYSLDIGVPNRSWRGLQVGNPEQQAQGALALLGPPHQTADVPGTLEIQSGFQVYSSPESRPIRAFTSEVRPPNGCYDVTVELMPRQIGMLVVKEQRYSVVGRVDEVPQYVVTRILVVDRSRGGPIDGKAC